VTVFVIILIVIALIVGVIASWRIEMAIRSATDELHARLDKIEEAVRAKL
jgi:hypothetical protein